MNDRPKTIFCDIDGTLVKHQTPEDNAKGKALELLPGTIEKLIEWDRKGYNIVLTTGRKESLRKATERQLSDVGIFYDQLVMGIGGGSRVLINDLKSDNSVTAYSYNVKRNEGIYSIDI
jgi:hypothetical protein